MAVDLNISLESTNIYPVLTEKKGMDDHPFLSRFSFFASLFSFRDSFACFFSFSFGGDFSFDMTSEVFVSTNVTNASEK
ncbi:MAG: hypothetical protein JXA72_07040 [Bacteroidales bacterium]|nr:hypothetical protein [Bacteroidales bacterium]